MEKFRNQYRIPSARLQSWNYGWNGAYFITICTKNRTPYFGEMGEGTMQLSHIGILANVFWVESKNHSRNIELGEFVVMPNHVHGILVINKPAITVKALHATSLRQPRNTHDYRRLLPT